MTIDKFIHVMLFKILGVIGVLCTVIEAVDLLTGRKVFYDDMIAALIPAIACLYFGFFAKNKYTNVK